MKIAVEPHAYHLAVWLITLSMAVLFGFLLGVIVNERGSFKTKRNPTYPRF